MSQNERGPPVYYKVKWTQAEAAEFGRLMRLYKTDFQQYTRFLDRNLSQIRNRYNREKKLKQQENDEQKPGQAEESDLISLSFELFE